MTAHLPKVELHCHFEGTISPELMQKIAQRNKMDIPQLTVNADGQYVWKNFIEFLEAYDKASSVIKTQQDYRDIAYSYLTAAAREGAIYVEMFTSPDHASEIGMSYTAMNEGIAQGIDDAERECGVVGRMIATCVRHLGPERAVKVAKTVAANPHPYVIGFGMGGDESQHTPLDFGPAFDLAFTAGLPCTSHAGEVLGAGGVEDTLDALPVVRIGHGVRAIEDAGLIERIVEEGIVLEVCPGSNLALGVYENPAQHPLKRLLDAGCKVTLGSDDPPFFQTSIGKEYQLAQTEFELSEDQLMGITQTAIDAAFVDDETKARLREKL